jgi:hypothetical protein
LTARTIALFFFRNFCRDNFFAAMTAEFTSNKHKTKTRRASHRFQAGAAKFADGFI